MVGERVDVSVMDFSMSPCLILLQFFADGDKQLAGVLIDMIVERRDIHEHLSNCFKNLPGLVGEEGAQVRRLNIHRTG